MSDSVRSRIGRPRLHALSVLTAVLVTAVSTVAQAPSPTYRVESIQGPPGSQTGVTYRWTGGFAVGDLDGDGIGDVWFRGSRDYYPGSTSTEALIGAGEIRGGGAFVADLGPGLGNLYQRSVAGLRTPTGVRGVVSLTSGVWAKLGVFDIPSASRVTDILGGHSGGIFLWPDRAVAAGDTNADGFDELLVVFLGLPPQGGEARVLRLLDGATGQEVWQATLFGSGEYAAYTAQFGGPQDVSLDSVADFVTASYDYNPFIANWETTARAFSGADGSVLWTQVAPGVTSGPNRIVEDLSGDGVPDVVLTTFFPVFGSNDTRLTALDGATGAVLWSQSINALGSWLPSWASRWVCVNDSVLYSQSDPWTGQQELVVLFWVFDGLGATEGYALAHFDAATGAVREVAWRPDTGSPWNSASFWLPGTIPGHTQLGDVDRDGLQEFCTQIIEPTWPSYPGLPSQGLAILGQTTLRCPASAQAGSQVAIDFAIPSAGGRTLRLLAATAVDRFDGYTLAGWDTGLASSDTLLAAVLAQPPILLPLNAAGRGTLQLQIPNVPWLVGQTLYLRGVVGNPSSTDPVWTMSSLGDLEVLP